MNIKQSEKGITLIALAVTIIVISIIAGISVSSSIGEKGTLNKTEDIKEAVEDKEEKDAIRIAIQEAMIASDDGKLKKEILKKYLKQHLEIANFEYDEATEKYKFISFKTKIEYEINDKGDILE